MRTFEKDNDARSGSKGDFIFRDVDEADTEIVVNHVRDEE